MNDSNEPKNYTSLLSNAVTIVKQAGNLLLKFFNSKHEIHYKGLFDMVTEADLASEKAIVTSLKKLTPEIQILAEESSSQSELKRQSSGYQWVIDPLDGTTNFAHGFPHFAISVALLNNGKPMLGIVFDPLKNELFTAINDQGASLNNSSIHVSSTSHSDKSLVATGFPYTIREIDQKNLIEFCTFRLACQGIRRFGAAALDLAYVASGRLDGFWEYGLKPWDTAAGILLVKEAGGNVTRYDGAEYAVNCPDIIASNGRIHPFMQRVLTADLPRLPDLPRMT